MRDIHKQRIIQTAIREYKESVLFGFSPSAPHAINMMEEALHMCRPYNVLGISVLENSLKEAKKKNAYVVLITMNNETQLAKYSNMTFYLPSTISYLQDKKILKQFDNRTTLHFFSEVISYYYGFYIENKKA